jgi:hypothetical protein
MPSRRIIYTRPDGGVSVCAPSDTALRYMTGGGGRWDDIVVWDRGFIDRQIAAQSKDGVGERAAHAFVMAMHKGGCSTPEAYGIMRDRFCAHLGTACELVEVADISTDRWFRNAWRRSPNGGPICVHLGHARRIQLDRIKAAVSKRNKSRIELGRKPIVPPWGEIGNAIRHARDEGELRRVWPSGL